MHSARISDEKFERTLALPHTPMKEAKLLLTYWLAGWRAST
jgi:hypothetical protein